MAGMDTIERQVDEIRGAMQEQRTKGRSLRRLQREYQGRPLAFFRDVLKVVLTPQQEEAIDAAQAHALLVLLGANGTGKDFTLSGLGMFWAYVEEALVIFTAPTQRQAEGILMEETRRHFHRAADLPGEIFQRAVRVPGSPHAAILSMTATESSRLTGWHAPLVRVGLSEGQGLAPHVVESAFAVAVGPQDRIMATANPTTADGWLYDAVTAPGTKWHTVRMPATEHVNVVSGRVIVPGACTRESVKRFADEYGTTSAIYQSRVLAQFPTSATSAVFPRDLLMAAVNRTLTPRAGDQVVAGIDTARSKAGSQIGLAVARGGQLVYLTTFHGPDTTLAASRILDELMPYQPQIIRLDVGGPGAGICDILRRAPSPGWRSGIEEVHFGGSPPPQERERYLNARAWLYYSLRVAMERETVGLLRDPALIEELAQPTFSFDARSRIVIEGKDLISARLGRSPDKADAVVMALAVPPAEPWVIHRNAF